MGGKPGLVQTTKDFSTQTSVKGEVTYIFERKRDLFDWLLWPFVILGFLTMAIFLLQVIFRDLVNSTLSTVSTKSLIDLEKMIGMSTKICQITSKHDTD